jgi:2,5-diketo-D-gluconate reductase A
LFEDPELQQLAGKYGKTVAQVVIRWHLDRGFVAIPKSVKPNRIEENFGVFDFALQKEDIAKIASLDSRDGRIGPTARRADRPNFNLGIEASSSLLIGLGLSGGSVVKT